MAKPENQAILGVHKHLPSFVSHEKMCNPFSAGTPDVWYSSWPHDLWVEFKFLEKPPSRAFTLGLTELQRLWLRDKYRQNRAVAVVLLFPAKFGGVIYTHLAWGERVGKIPAPTPEMIVSRKLIADFITQSCTSDAHHSSLTYSSKSRPSDLPDRVVWDGCIPDYSEPQA